MRKKWRLALAALCLCAGPSMAAISVQDDAGKTVTLAKPAQRVVTLAPHATELVFAAGGGARIVGTVSYSDFPPAAKSIPQIGDNRQIDIERMIALKPDLIIAWQYGNAQRQIEQLRQLGIPLFYSEPRKLDDIASSVLRIGRLLGADQTAQAAAAELRQKLNDLKLRYQNRPPVRLFYQVWDKPLYTLNGQHIVSDAMRLCGGENIFAGMAVTAPNVGIEAVLQQDPEAIISGDQRNQSGGGINIWKPYTTMTAVRRGNLFSLNGDLLSRSGPRMVEGAAALCAKLELARQHRKSK
ncbi:cobalamin-binding protein [Herminiimonas sp. CN]|uniref:cobalamin-binding protein n=1 Tax=Herminiimonas sp. CN TaxID=1349818 RepID=UPI0004743E81|nr:cobalamin-binding protein [Herminiimonas sp. CN]